MQPSMPMPAAPDSGVPPEVLSQLTEAAKKLIDDRIEGEATAEKQYQYLRLRKVDLYYRDLQFLVPVMGAAQIPVDWEPLDGNQYSIAEEESGLYDYFFNIIRDYGRKFVPVLGSRPFFNSKALARNKRKENDISAARQWDLITPWLDRMWDLRILNLELFFKQYTAGTVYGYVYPEADEELFGVVEKPRYETRTEQPPGEWNCRQCGWTGPQEAAPIYPAGLDGVEKHQCPQCGAVLEDYQFTVPPPIPYTVQNGTIQVPRVGPKLALHTGYNVTVPDDAVRVDNKLAWLVWQNEDLPGELYQVYGEKLRKIVKENGSVDENTLFGATGMAARSSQTSTLGIVRQNTRTRWPHSKIWLNPLMYEVIPDEKVRAAYKQYFPKGCKICRVGAHVVDIVPEVLAKRWAATKPECSPTLYCDPYAWSTIGQQDITNNAWNTTIAFSERKIPSSLVLAELGIVDQIASRSSMAREMIEVAPGFNRSLRDSVATIPTPNGEIQEYMPLIQGVRASVEQLLGLLPPVWGGGERQPTAEGQRVVLNQALMQLTTPGEYASSFYSHCKTNAIELIKELARQKDVEVAADSDSEDLVDMDALLGGEAYIDSNNGIPQSFNEKRDALRDLVTQGKEVAHAMGLDLPDNAPYIRDYIIPGMAEMTLPDEDAKNRVNDTIQKLLQIGSTGFVPEQQSDGSYSLPPGFEPDPFLDEPDKFASLVRNWCNSRSGLSAKEQNPNGFRLVAVWGLAQKNLFNQMNTPAQGAAPGGPAPNGEAPAPPNGNGGGAPAQAPSGPEQPPEGENLPQ